MMEETIYKVNFLKGPKRDRDAKIFFFKEAASKATCNKSYFYYEIVSTCPVVVSNAASVITHSSRMNDGFRLRAFDSIDPVSLL